MRSLRYSPFVCLLTVAVLALSVGGQQPTPKTKPTGRPQASPLKKQFFRTTKRGLTWLKAMQNTDGRFHYGWVPALAGPAVGDNFLAQAKATFGLARASRYLEDEEGLAQSAQAILSLLDDTTTDPKNAQVRYTSLAVIDRLGSAGLIVSAINELPKPEKDLLAKSEQLCNYIRSQARADGSLRYSDKKVNGSASVSAQAQAVVHPGEAMYGLMLSQRHRPAEWKVQLVRKSVGYYHSWWQKHKNTEMIPVFTAAYSEAYRVSKDPALAKCVFEMNDWLCRLQITQIDPEHLLWRGGFMSWTNGRAVQSHPDMLAARYAESLEMACRVAQVAKDNVRFHRYRVTLEMALQFVENLQYTEASTQHFKDTYRPFLVGGFHASTRDGSIQVADASHALSALVLYLEHMAGPARSLE